MAFSKTIIINGVVAAVVVTSIGAYLIWENSSKQKDTEASLLEKYENLLEEVKDSETKANLLANCDNPQKFSNQIQLFETELELLNIQKNKTFKDVPKNDNEDEWIPPIPGSEAPDLGPASESDVESRLYEDEWIPPIPGSEAPDLGPASESDVESRLYEDEWIPPIPGSEAPDLGPASESDVESRLYEDEWIPPIPGSEAPDLGPASESDVESRLYEDEWIPPIPGSEAPDLGPASESDVESRLYEDEWIPPIPGSEAPDLGPAPKNITIDDINIIEEKILEELNNFKSLCDKEEKKEIISTSCPEACKKYSDCASFADDMTETDEQEAYESCMIECADWSDKTKICINKKPIKAPIDCTTLTLCALPEYGGYGAE